jgi:hypothetical protein
MEKKYGFLKTILVLLSFCLFFVTCATYSGVNTRNLDIVGIPESNYVLYATTENPESYLTVMLIQNDENVFIGNLRINSAKSSKFNFKWSDKVPPDGSYNIILSNVKASPNTYWKAIDVQIIGGLINNSWDNFLEIPLSHL